MNNKSLSIPLKSEKGTYLLPTCLPGPIHMALDLMLLEKSILESNNSPLIRLYTWKGNYLSIGRNQNLIPSEWKRLVDIGKINIVRRPSGGGAVLHCKGLTYCLIWPSPPRQKREAYLQASQWLIEAFNQLGLPLEFGNQSQSLIDSNCFATATNADLIDKNGFKRIGSAQLWKQGYLLQHGEIILDPPQDLWLEVFNKNPPKPAPKSIPRRKLKASLEKALVSSWSDIKWIKKVITQKELSEAKLKAKNYEFKID